MQINRESQEFYFVFFSFICKLTVNWQRLNTREIDILAFNIDRWTRSNWSVLSLMHFVCKQPITFCVSGTASLRSNRMFGYSYGVRTPSYHPLNWQSKPLLGYVIPPNKSAKLASAFLQRLTVSINRFVCFLISWKNRRKSHGWHFQNHF